MILHLGRSVSVPQDTVVGIFDLERTTAGNGSEKVTRQFLADAQKGNRVYNVCEEELPRSFVVCVDREGTETVYISQLSPATLRKRAAFPRV